MIGKLEGLTNKQKQIMVELDKCTDEISGQQLHRILLKGAFNIGLTTVYRNLRTLQQKGLVRCRNLPTGEALYSPLKRDNHHLTCIDCGQTLVLKTCPIKNIELPKAQIKDFELLFHTLEFFGLCKSCKKRQELL